jgi:hypothetical protein
MRGADLQVTVLYLKHLTTNGKTSERIRVAKGITLIFLGSLCQLG